jgi:glycosyltransferase involved in cell wall biosynthesis
VFLVCPGLGHVVRGYEAFTRECFDALAPDDRLDLYLYKGAGRTADRERLAWCPRRNRLATRMVATLIRRDGYYVEQTGFALALIARITRLRPDVIYFSDGAVGNLLWRWRQLSGARFKLLLSNGGPLGPPAFPRIDHVHQVSPVYHEESLRAGRPAATQTLIPYGFQIDPWLRPQVPDERRAVRKTLGLPEDRPVVLSVGAINGSHKRMDYVIREVASLPAPRPYLLLLGNTEAETPPMIRLGRELLGADAFRAATVSQAEVPAYYRAADLLVLASLKEGFGRVFVEALSQGLLCVAHDYPVARWVLGKSGLYRDLSVPGALAELIGSFRFGEETSEDQRARHQRAYDRFSWDRLRDGYVEMIQRCAAEPTYRDCPTRRYAPALAVGLDGNG